MTTVTRQEFTELTERVDQRGQTLGHLDDGFRSVTENIQGLSKKVTEGFENLDKRLGGLEGRMGGLDTRMDRLETDVSIVKFDVAAAKADIAIIKAHLLGGQS